MVAMHDGSRILLKLGPDYDPTDKMNAFRTLEELDGSQQFITGLIYINQQERPDLHELLHVPETPLVHLTGGQAPPSRRAEDDGEAVDRKLEAGSWKPEAGSRKRVRLTLGHCRG